MDRWTDADLIELYEERCAVREYEGITALEMDLMTEAQRELAQTGGRVCRLLRHEKTGRRRSPASGDTGQGKEVWQMAGDWIKFETCTCDKPEVCAIACELDIDPDAVIGKLLRIWTWFDSHSTNGNAPSVTKVLLDRRVGVTGFCNAMVKCGWMLEEGGMLSIPNFDRHNGETAKKRAQTAKRVANSRGGNASSVTGDAKCNAPSVTKSATTALAREEKRREEKNNSLTHTRELSEHWKKSGEFRECWLRWLSHVAQTKAPISEAGEQQQLYDLARFDTLEAIAIVRYSTGRAVNLIMNGDHKKDSREVGPPPARRRRVPSFEEGGLLQ